MFTVKEVRRMVSGGKCVIEGACLSTDEKPIRFANGSQCFEMDTGKMFFFDEENGIWYELKLGEEEPASE